MEDVSETEILEKKRTEVEKIMMLLSPETKDMHRWYLAGWIDNQRDTCQISENVRSILYETYGP